MYPPVLLSRFGLCRSRGRDLAIDNHSPHIRAVGDSVTIKHGGGRDLSEFGVTRQSPFSHKGPKIQRTLYCLRIANVVLCSVPYHRVEDRIRQLCARVLAAPESELHPAIADLQRLLREHALYLENATIDYLLQGTIKLEPRRP